MSTPNARLYSGTVLMIAGLTSLAWVSGGDWLLAGATFAIGVALVLTSFAEVQT